VGLTIYYSFIRSLSLFGFTLTNIKLTVKTGVQVIHKYHILILLQTTIPLSVFPTCVHSSVHSRNNKGKTYRVKSIVEYSPVSVPSPSPFHLHVFSTLIHTPATKESTSAQHYPPKMDKEDKKKALLHTINSSPAIPDVRIIQYIIAVDF